MSNLTDKLQIKINDQQQEVNALLVEQIKLLNETCDILKEWIVELKQEKK